MILLAALMSCGPLFSAPTPTKVSITPYVTLPSSPSQEDATVETTAAASPEPGSDDFIQTWMDAISVSNMMQTVFALSNLPTRHVNNSTIQDVAQIIYDRFIDAGGNLQVSTDKFPLLWNGVLTTQQNVAATLPGTDPTAGIVLIGAHYDSRTADLNDAVSPAPGANDNASGVAIMLELARVLAPEARRTTIVFAAFSAEEVGRVGSKHYVEAAQARNDDIRVVIVLDIVGNSAGPTGEGSLRVFSADPPDSPSRQLAYRFEKQSEHFMPGLDIQVQPTIDRPGRYSDHVAFSEVGIPAIRLIEPIEDPGRQHSAFDTPDTVSGDYLRVVAQVLLAYLGSLR